MGRPTAQAQATPRPDPLLLLSAVHANSHHKATSMASYGRPSLPFASPSTLKTPKTPKTPKTLKTVKTLQKRMGRPTARRSQPTGTPRPHQWLLRLLMGVQACRLPAPKPLKRLKPLKRRKRLKLLKLCQSVWDAQPRRHKLPQGQIHRFF